MQFNWKWVTEQQKLNKWGPLTSNLLLVGMEGEHLSMFYMTKYDIISANIQNNEKEFLLTVCMFSVYVNFYLYFNTVWKMSEPNFHN